MHDPMPVIAGALIDDAAPPDEPPPVLGVASPLALFGDDAAVTGELAMHVGPPEVARDPAAARPLTPTPAGLPLHVRPAAPPQRPPVLIRATLDPGSLTPTGALRPPEPAPPTAPRDDAALRPPSVAIASDPAPADGPDRLVAEPAASTQPTLNAVPAQRPPIAAREFSSPPVLSPPPVPLPSPGEPPVFSRPPRPPSAASIPVALATPPPRPPSAASIPAAPPLPPPRPPSAASIPAAPPLPPPRPPSAASIPAAPAVPPRPPSAASIPAVQPSAASTPVAPVAPPVLAPPPRPPSAASIPVAPPVPPSAPVPSVPSSARPASAGGELVELSDDDVESLDAEPEFLEADDVEAVEPPPPAILQNSVDLGGPNVWFLSLMLGFAPLGQLGAAPVRGSPLASPSHTKS